RRPREDLPRPRLQELLEHRLPRPHRALRGHALPRSAEGARAPGRVDGRAQGGDDPPGPEDPAHVGDLQDPRGHDHTRRGPSRHGGRLMPPPLELLLKAMLDKGASDLHITANSPPVLRIDGQIVPMRLDPMTPVDTKQLCYSILTDAQKLRFEEENEIDFSFGVKGLARFRGNCFMQRGAVAGAFRMIPFKIVPLADLGMPPIVDELCNKPRGLVLVTGPTGSGKSTTLASMIDKINSEHREHIVTIEDPIEFLHPHKNCVVNQREVGADTTSF